MTTSFHDKNNYMMDDTTGQMKFTMVPLLEFWLDSNFWNQNWKYLSLTADTGGVSCIICVEK